MAVAAVADAQLHEIFLSHSGAQKGFANDLYLTLSSLSYSVFYDQRHHSLPPGHDFPHRIFSAAHTCNIAILVLSEEFLTSRWPMIELCAFADRLRSASSAVPIDLVPLFYKISPEEIKDKDKVKRWRQVWKGFQEGDSRMSAEKCEDAITKLLPRLNGVVRRPENEQGEKTYIQKVVDAIFDILPPKNLFQADPNKSYVAKERLCQIILDKFRELEEDPVRSPSSSSDDPMGQPHGCSIVGMYGFPGSGKSTLCRLLCASMFQEFRGKVIYVELSVPFDPRNALVQLLTELLQFSSMAPPRNIASMHLNKVYNFLSAVRVNRKIFLVLDNIRPSNDDELEFVKKTLLAILCPNIVRPGSRILLVARSVDTLQDLELDKALRLLNVSGSLQQYKLAITEVPRFNNEEALEVIRRQFDSMDRAREDLIKHILGKASFGQSFVCLPLVFKLIGVLLRQKNYADTTQLDVELRKFWQRVEELRKDAVQELVGKIFEQLSEDLQVLFLDIALFILPAGYSRSSDAALIVCHMHDIPETTERVLMRMEELGKNCLLSVSRDKGNQQQIRIHDICLEYAKNRNNNIGPSYINESLSTILDQRQPCSVISVISSAVWDRCSTIAYHCRAKCSDARTIIIESRSDYSEDPGSAVFAREVSLDVEIGPTSRALLVRNNASSSCKLSLSLSGNFSSVVFFKLKNVEQLEVSPDYESATAHVYPTKLVWFEWKNDDQNMNITGTNWMKDADNGSHDQNAEGRTGWLDVIGRGGYQIQCSLQQFMKLLSNKVSLPMFHWRQTTYNRFVNNMVASPWMKVLKLKNVYVQRLEDVGRCCPVLEDLEVVDEARQLMYVSIGSAPKLKRLFIGPLFQTPGKFDILWRANYNRRGLYSYKKEVFPRKSSKLVLRLQECPQLQHIYVDVSLFDHVQVVGSLPSTLNHLGQNTCGGFISVQLIASCHRLSLLQTLELRCSKMELLDFTLLCLPVLKDMLLRFCTNLTHLFIGPGCLPNLQQLQIDTCSKLKIFEGLHILLIGQLRRLHLVRLPGLQCRMSLQSSCDREVCLQLEWIEVIICPGLKIDFHILEMSRNIKAIRLRDTCVTLLEPGLPPDILLNVAMRSHHLRWLTLLNVSLDYDLDDNADKCANIDDEMHHHENPLHRSSSLLPKCPSASLYQLRCLECRCEALDLSGLRFLHEIDGIENLHNLRMLCLSKHPNLIRISGKWPSRITWIELVDCPMLQTVPRLEDTPRLWRLVFDRCAKLEAVEGDFGQMKELKGTTFSYCESMNVFPMEDLMEQLRRGPGTADHRKMELTVKGSKFANVKVIQRWLQMAEFGSPLFKAAAEGLLCEHLTKGHAGVDALDLLEAFARIIDIGSCLRNLSAPSNFSQLMECLTSPSNVRRLTEWLSEPSNLSQMTEMLKEFIL